MKPLIIGCAVAAAVIIAFVAGAPIAPAPEEDQAEARMERAFDRALRFKAALRDDL